MAATRSRSVEQLAMHPLLDVALKAGTGAFVGFLLGSVVKIALAMVVVGIIVVRLMW